MAEFAGFINENGCFKGEYLASLASTVTIYVESMVGIQEGGWTGLTTLMVGF